MLGRDAVDQRWRFAPIRDGDNSAVCLPALAGDVGARQAFQMAFDRRGNRASKTVIVGDQDRLRGGVVLGL